MPRLNRKQASEIEFPESSFELGSITIHLENFLCVFIVTVPNSEITLPKIYNNFLGGLQLNLDGEGVVVVVFLGFFLVGKLISFTLLLFGM